MTDFNKKQRNSNLLYNPKESTGALVEGRDIMDIDVTNEDFIVPKDYQKFYLSLADAAVMHVKTISGNERTATFPAGVVPVGITRVYSDSTTKILTIVL